MRNVVPVLAILIALFSLWTATISRDGGLGAIQKKETAFNRVMRTRTIRCAYVVRPPHIIMDVNSNKISGIDYEIMEAIGKAADLKIEWQEEVGYGVFPEHLNSGKQDVFCSLVLISARRAQRVELSRPVEYMPLHAYVKNGDHRFDNNFQAINDAAVKIAVIDGSSQKAATDSAFPLASQYSLPGDSDNSQTTIAVAAGKADVVVSEDNTIHDYNKRNAEKALRRVPNSYPIRTYAEAFAVPKGELELVALLDSALQELDGNGVIDAIISKYEPVAGSIFRMQKPYRIQ